MDRDQPSSVHAIRFKFVPPNGALLINLCLNYNYTARGEVNCSESIIIATELFNAFGLFGSKYPNKLSSFFIVNYYIG